MALEKPGNSENFFLLLCGHSVQVQYACSEIRPEANLMLLSFSSDGRPFHTVRDNRNTYVALSCHCSHLNVAVLLLVVTSHTNILILFLIFIGQIISM